MRYELTRSLAVGNDGKPSVDLRIGPIQTDAASGFKIRITNPQSAWGKAGLHSGDRLISVDGSPVASWPDLRAWLRSIRIGNVGRLVIERNGVRHTIEVPITGYNVPTVRISDLPNATRKQARLRSAWLNAR